MLHMSIEYKLSTTPTQNRLAHPLVEILKRVQEAGSIGRAATQMGRSYRYVWGELKRWESELNTPLIVWGRTSKGAELTPNALRFLRAISKTEAELEQSVALIKQRVAKCLALIKST